MESKCRPKFLLPKPRLASNAKAAAAPVSVPTPPIAVSWVYTGAADTQIEEFKGKPVVPNPAYTGKVGLSHAPGKQLLLGRDGKRHNRDLAADVKQLKERGVSAIFCLLNKYELRTIGVDQTKYERACKAAGIELNCFGIVEMGVPEGAEVGEFRTQIVDVALAHMKKGENILIHCRGGIGRASTVAACILAHVWVGAGSRDLVRLLRRRRDKKAVESMKQEDFISAYIKGIRGELKVSDKEKEKVKVKAD